MISINMHDAIEKRIFHLDQSAGNLVSFMVRDSEGNECSSFTDDPAFLRSLAADLIKGAEYLEGIEPGQSLSEVDDLRQQLQAAQELNRALSAQVEGWVSVDFDLPPTGKKVIASFLNDHGKRRTIMAHYIHRWEVESDPDDECNFEYSEEKDTYYIQEGWYENVENWPEYTSFAVCEGAVDYWMKKPEDPK